MNEKPDSMATFYVEVGYSPWISSSRLKAYRKAFAELDRLTNGLNGRVVSVEDKILNLSNSYGRRNEDGIRRVVVYKTLDEKL